MACRRGIALFVVLLPLGLTGCMGGGEKAAGTSSAQAVGNIYEVCAKAGDLDKAAYFDAFKKSSDMAKTAHLEGKMEATAQVSAGSAGAAQSGSFTGDVDVTDASNPKTSMKVSVQGNDIDVILLDKLVYMKMGSLTNGKYMKASVEEMASKGGFDMQAMTNPAAQLEKSRDAITKVSCVGREDVSGNKAVHVRVTIDAEKSAALLNPGGSSSSSAKSTPGSTPQSIEGDQWFDEKGRLLKIDTGSGATKMSMTYSKWNEPVSITAPPADMTMPMPA
ncbi:LppX_LprAFG lipoprotein [Austwickia chelonae]|uniref:LppX_LprAFG lipoprotein n=1 Tax=Austwickia chelonae TaxID=100225 RepID=UPI000E2367ED|nr:LppX_LprAFG lipoprotein [Austwickia chelonae]